MTVLPGPVIFEDVRYVLHAVDGESAISFRWKHVTELSVSEYMDAIRAIARTCLARRPELVLIDVRDLDVAVRFDEEWWATEILPVYHQAGVARFAHITGAPDAIGEQANTPSGVRFRMGQFTDLEAALEWNILATTADDERNTTMENSTVLEDHEQYEVLRTTDGKALVLAWKHVVGLSVLDDRAAIGSFAELCKAHQPDRAVIDAAQVENPQLTEDTDLEEFVPWWSREIVPAYHAAEIAGLAIVIGDPNAPGETSEIPPGVNFRMGYFADRESALSWNLS